MSGASYIAVTKSSQSNDLDTDNLDNIQFYRPRKGGSPFKDACDCFRNRPRFALIAIGFAILFIIILITIIALSVKRNAPTPPKEEHKYPIWQMKKYGLNYFPAAGTASKPSALFNFRPMVHNSYAHYYNYLNGFLHDYNILYQQNPNKYVDCNKTYAPGDKVCKFASTQLGKCSTFHEYGYHEGNPCVLLSLEIPPHIKPQPLARDETDLGNHWSADYIGVTCKGVAPADMANIGKKYTHDIPNIEYFPERGFPTYFYRNLTNADNFLHPLVMVKFNTLTDHHYIDVECTAWLKSVDQTKQGDFTAKFSFYIH